MANSSLMLKVVRELLNDAEVEELPTTICTLLTPFAKKKATIDKHMAAKVDKIVHSYGICTRCRNEPVKQPIDLFCKHCKSLLKEKAKASIE